MIRLADRLAAAARPADTMLAFTVAGTGWLLLLLLLLHQLVEVVVMVRAAMHVRGLTVQATNLIFRSRPGIHVVDALVRYAGLLAAQPRPPHCPGTKSSNTINKFLKSDP